MQLDIFEKVLLPAVCDMFADGAEFILQQDGAQCHTARQCKKWFQDNNTELLTWPGNNPDLNPMENLCYRLTKVVASKHPSNKQELIEGIIKLMVPHHISREIDEPRGVNASKLQGSDSIQRLSNSLLMSPRLFFTL